MKRLLVGLLLLPISGLFGRMSIDPTMEPDSTYTGTYQSYPYLRTETKSMIQRNDMVRLRATTDQIERLQDKLHTLKQALITNPAHAQEIQKTIDMVNDMIDTYEAKAYGYKRSLGLQ